MSPADRTHVLVEAKKRAFLDRETHGSDPRFQAVPLEMLLSEAHADELAAQHRHAPRRHHAAHQRGQRRATPPISASSTAPATRSRRSRSINSGFGSGVTAGDTGVLLNNRMAYWHLADGHANRLQPGKRVRHTMNAPVVLKDGKLVAVLGTPGADNQVQVNLQVATSMLDLGWDPQTAVEAPRWTSSQSGQGANWPHEGDASLTIERDVGDAVLADLARRGHEVKPVPHLEGPCSMQVIRLMDNGVRMAASDPRRGRLGRGVLSRMARVGRSHEGLSSSTPTTSSPACSRRSRAPAIRAVAVNKQDRGRLRPSCPRLLAGHGLRA